MASGLILGIRLGKQGSVGDSLPPLRTRMRPSRAPGHLSTLYESRICEAYTRAILANLPGGVALAATVDLAAVLVAARKGRSPGQGDQGFLRRNFQKKQLSEIGSLSLR
jgi:hypothetical protein